MSLTVPCGCWLWSITPAGNPPLSMAQNLTLLQHLASTKFLRISYSLEVTGSLMNQLFNVTVVNKCWILAEHVLCKDCLNKLSYLVPCSYCYCEQWTLGFNMNVNIMVFLKCINKPTPQCTLWHLHRRPHVEDLTLKIPPSPKSDVSNALLTGKCWPLKIQ